MNINIICHIMPWEIDYALLSFTQFKKSKYYLPSDVNITINTALNLSSYLIDWNQSKLPKEYFIEKYNTISILLNDYNHNKTIYDGDEMFGFFDFQRTCINKETDYYIHMCPDIYFSEYVLTYLIESAKQITNKYFVITPQVSKVGDKDWDRIVNPEYMNIPYSDYLKTDVFDIRYNNKHNNQEIELTTLSKSKFAGWFDLYNKAFYEELCPIQNGWTGYGPWDYYSILISDVCKAQGVDYQQYLLRGETIWMYPSGPLSKEGVDGFSQYYKNFIVLRENKHNQRKEFENNMAEYINKGVNDLKIKNLLPQNLHVEFRK